MLVSPQDDDLKIIGNFGSKEKKKRFSGWPIKSLNLNQIEMPAHVQNTLSLLAVKQLYKDDLKKKGGQRLKVVVASYLV